nr:YitT family protein [uncultured Sellimonas sp.]
MEKLTEGITPGMIFWIAVGAGIATFGIHNIHEQTGITEGGVIGMMLLLHHWFHIPSGWSTPVLDISCYLLAFRFLGGHFIKVSILSTFCVSMFYNLWDLFPYMLPDLSAYPLAAALLGGVFVGIGVGLIVRQGGSSGGDDALALSISRVTGWRLSRAYLFTDLVVLGLSISYIPVIRIAFSVVTVMLSSLLIDFVQNFRRQPEPETVGE